MLKLNVMSYSLSEPGFSAGSICLSKDQDLDFEMSKDQG